MSHRMLSAGIALLVIVAVPALASGRQARPSRYAATPLSAVEAASLAFMREEEAVARAVYVASAAMWPQVPVFANIAASEATHMAAVRNLLVRYGEPDPIEDLPLGIFATAEFQDLHDALVATSELSLIDALRVGAEIEELDISDLNGQMADIAHPDILAVYDHLRRGSRNHLRAFMRVLTQMGGTYVPVHLSQAEFDAIVNSPMERGR